ncbi:hypothetical protein FRC08_009153 [Ceratobasidium sp. 394]|nr:hypothetical protein FRC08_009153 [Ceratobasidium sp. 394]
MTPKFIYLPNADDISPSIPAGGFVVYQGHHGDVAAQLAAPAPPLQPVPPPGAAREDWKILRALSEVVGSPLPYDDVLTLRDRMWDISPALVRYDIVEKTSLGVAQAGLNLFAQNKESGKSGAFEKVIKNFYVTDPISRASVTMAQCTRAFVPGSKISLTSYHQVPGGLRTYLAAESSGKRENIDADNSRTGCTISSEPAQTDDSTA